jgi:hypothetical protein
VQHGVELNRNAVGEGVDLDVRAVERGLGIEVPIECQLDDERIDRFHLDQPRSDSIVSKDLEVEREGLGGIQTHLDGIRSIEVIGLAVVVDVLVADRQVVSRRKHLDGVGAHAVGEAAVSQRVGHFHHVDASTRQGFSGDAIVDDPLGEILGDG